MMQLNAEQVTKAESTYDTVLKMAETLKEAAMKGTEAEHTRKCRVEYDTKEHINMECKTEKGIPHPAANRTQQLEVKRRLEDGREAHFDTSEYAPSKNTGTLTEK